MKNQQDMVKTLFIKLARSEYIPVNNLTSEFQFFFLQLHSSFSLILIYFHDDPILNIP